MPPLRLAMSSSSAVKAAVVAAAAATLVARGDHVYADSSFRFPYLSSRPPATNPEQRASDGQPSSDGSSDGSSSTREFDPEALEQMAKHLREISNSPFSKQVFKLMREQEKARLVEVDAEKAQVHALRSQEDIERQRKLAEEQRNLPQQQAQAKAQNMRNEDELARKRMQTEHEAQRRLNVERVKMEEESSMRREQARRAADEKIQAQLLQTEKEKAVIERQTFRDKKMAEAEAGIYEKKQTEDQQRMMLLEEMKGEKEKWMAAINTTFNHIEGGLRTLLTDRSKLTMSVLAVTGLAAGVYTTREGARVTWGYINRILGQPSLIRESSMARFPWSRISSSIVKKASGSGTSSGDEASFERIILHPSLKRRIEQLAHATENTKSHEAPFRNMLFYGPPGTGKTLVAREMARKSGKLFSETTAAQIWALGCDLIITLQMDKVLQSASKGLDYAMMTGGDVAPLGSEAVTKIHQIFDWAKNSRKGLLLFIDEADAFLCERNSIHMSEAQRSALNALLFRTGDQSRDIVLVLATNRPGDLDAAVTDRIDEVLGFPLPGEEERFKLLKLYLNQYISREDNGGPWWRSLFKKKQQKIVIKDVTEDVLLKAAKKTEGFSGREIAKLVASIQAAVYGRPACSLDSQLFMEIVDYKVAEHHQRIKLAAGTP